MAYTYELNIGSLATPIRGNGWLQVYPFTKGCSLVKSKVEDEVFARTTLNGRIKFSGDEATALLTLSAAVQEIGFRIKWKGTVIFTGLLGTRGEADEESLETWHVVEPDDDYTKIMTGKDRDINILGGDAVIKSANVEFQERPVLKFATSPYKADDIAIFTTTADFQDPIYAREELTVTDEIAALMIGKNGYYEVSSSGGNTVLGRSWNKAGIDKDLFLFDVAKCESTVNLLILLNDYVTFTPAACPNCSTDYTGYICGYDYVAGTGIHEYYMIQERFFLAGDTFTYTRLRKLNDVIIDMLADLDSDITTDSNSFLWGSSIFNHLLVGAISDMKLVTVINTKEESSNPASKELVTWQKLWDTLKQQPYGFYWYIESGVLRIRHISEIAKSSGTNPDLTNWQGVNWCTGKQRYVWDNTKHSRIVRQSNAANPDFFGVDVILSDTVGLSELKITQDYIYTDIAHIYTAPDDYPDNGIVLLACYVATGQPYDYECYVGAGVLTGLDIANWALANSTLDALSISGGDLEYPYTFKSGKVNGVTETLAEIKRRRITPIYAPFRTPDEVDFGELVTTENGDVEAVEIEIPLEAIEGGAKITCIY